MPLQPFNKGFDSMVTNIFNEADSNEDGSVSVDELYEMVLKLYITINQEAPVKPPSRKQVYAS